ncbi:hypothetical protein D3C80_1331480 [compost metagenome]
MARHRRHHGRSADRQNQFVVMPDLLCAAHHFLLRIYRRNTRMGVYRQLELFGEVTEALPGQGVSGLV